MDIRNPKSVIDESPMGVRQWTAIAITVGLNALDGIDILSVSYAAPGIVKEWGLAPSTLGWILSMELVGMALGSILLGGIADRIGRKPTILGCLVIMSVGMAGTGQSANVEQLLSWRLLTGLGIGGMLPTINAAAAEFSNNRWRNLAMSLMVIGYPVGGALGGLFVQFLLADGGHWRSIFHLGAFATVSFVPLIWFLVPETPAFLDRRQPAGALDKVNRILARFGHKAVTGLSQIEIRNKAAFLDIFGPGLRTTTLLITLVYFAHATSMYFIFKWTPQLVVNMGFEPSAAAGVLAYFNIGGALGGTIFGILATRFSLKAMTTLTMLATGCLVAWFGFGEHELLTLKLQILAAGVFATSSIAGLYLLFAKLFPTQVRATGTGFVIGVGRGAAALAPVITGYLFSSGYSLTAVALIMGSGSLIAGVVLQALRERQAD